ncbi:MAG: CvpA family protein [Muribaculaceae bacterium]|nr:CvpA family protein [Muribaculaceae bacterium]
MLNGLYHIIIIIVVVWSVITGYHKGFMRQLGMVVSVAFGIVISRIFSPGCLPYVEEFVPEFVAGFKRPFVVQTLTSGLLFVVSGGVMFLITLPLAMLSKAFSLGILNSMGGALFRGFLFLLLVSLLYNLIADMAPRSSITQSSRQHDGNLVEGVTKIAPAILGFPGAEEVGYMQQLEDAKKIS